MPPAAESEDIPAWEIPRTPDYKYAIKSVPESSIHPRFRAKIVENQGFSPLKRSICPLAMTALFRSIRPFSASRQPNGAYAQARWQFHSQVHHVERRHPPRALRPLVTHDENLVQ